MLTTLVILASIATGYLAWSLLNREREQQEERRVVPIRIRADDDRPRHRR